MEIKLRTKGRLIHAQIVGYPIGYAIAAGGGYVLLAGLDGRVHSVPEDCLEVITIFGDAGASYYRRQGG